MSHILIEIIILCITIPMLFSLAPKRLVKSSHQHRPKLTSRGMFSGIIEEMGTVEELRKRTDMLMWDGSISEGVEFTVKAKKSLEDSYLGCSIAINGVCLTATALGEDQFTVGLAPETLRRTNLGALSKGEPVNLERALRADGRNSWTLCSRSCRLHWGR